MSLLQIYLVGFNPPERPRPSWLQRFLQLAMKGPTPQSRFSRMSWQNGQAGGRKAGHKNQQNK
jgi:hypothetical protein